MRTAFISYSSQDRDLARRVAELVRCAGLQVWMDEGALAPGEYVESGLNRAIAAADVFIAVLTKNAVHSHWVEFELTQACDLMSEHKTRVVPLVFDEGVLPASIAHLKWGDCRTPEGLVHSINMALPDAANRLPLTTSAVRERYEHRAPVRFAVRLIPSSAVEQSGLLGPEDRRYVFVGDYAEQSGRSLRQVLANLWAGDAYDEVRGTDNAWTAVIFEVGEINVRKLDLLPATWKAMFRIVSDRRRLGLIDIDEGEKDCFGRRPPYDYYTEDQPFWYTRLSEPRVWHINGESTVADGRPYLERLFGFTWWCYDGTGITRQGPRSSLNFESVPSRLFLVKNQPLRLLDCRQQDLGRPQDGRILI